MYAFNFLLTLTLETEILTVCTAPFILILIFYSLLFDCHVSSSF